MDLVLQHLYTAIYVYIYDINICINPIANAIKGEYIDRVGLQLIAGACYPKIPNIDKILTNIGHRFVHQSGLDESSRQKSTIVVFYKID